MTEQARVNASPDHPTVKLGYTQRAIGRLLNISLDEAPAGQAQADLAGDLFWNLYAPGIGQEDRQDLPGSRQINAHLIDWLKSTEGFGRMVESTGQNLPVSLVSSALSWAALTTEEALAEAMKRQEEAEAAEAKAAAAQAQANAQKAAAEALAEEGEGEAAEAMAAAAAAAQEEANEAAAEAMAAAAQAQELLDEAGQDYETKAAIAAKAREAAEEAEDLAEGMAAYGLGPGAPGYNDPKAAEAFLEKYGDKLEEIARLAGRMRGIALSSSREKVEVGQIIGDIQTTQNLLDVMPTELAYLRPDSPSLLRAQKVAQLTEGGLPGYRRYGEAKEEGPVVIVIDGSGSMGGTPEIMAKAVAIGVGQAVRANGRPFILATFSSNSDPVYAYDSEEDFQALMDWAEKFQGGGTSFDRAFATMINKLDALREKAQGVDAIFVTDGAGHLSDHWRQRWQEYRQERGSRFLLVPVGKFDSSFLGDIPDLVMPLDDLSNDSGESLAASLGAWIR